MRIAMVLMASWLLACSRPNVLPNDDDASPPEQVDTDPLTSKDAETLLRALVAARNAGNVEAVVGFYQDGARILAWRGKSSWLKTPPLWSRELVAADAEITLNEHWVLSLGLHTRVVATFDVETSDRRTRDLHLYELKKQDNRWTITKEAAITSIDLTAQPLSRLSKPVLADLSYRKEPEVAFLRQTGSSTTHPELDWKALAGDECPPDDCKARLAVELVTVSLSGKIYVDTHLRGFREQCSALPRVELQGSIRVFEREALVIEEQPPGCAGKDAWGTALVVGVRNTETKTLLSLDRSRVIEVSEEELRIEHSAEPGAKVQKVRMIPRKQEDRLVFKAEPEDAPKLVTGAAK